MGEEKLCLNRLLLKHGKQIAIDSVKYCLENCNPGLGCRKNCDSETIFYKMVTVCLSEIIIQELI